jgi:hypothetical protein
MNKTVNSVHFIRVHVFKIVIEKFSIFNSDSIPIPLTLIPIPFQFHWVFKFQFQFHSNSLEWNWDSNGIQGIGIDFSITTLKH